MSNHAIFAGHTWDICDSKVQWTSMRYIGLVTRLQQCFIKRISEVWPSLLAIAMIILTSQLTHPFSTSPLTAHPTTPLYRLSFHPQAIQIHPGDAAQPLPSYVIWDRACWVRPARGACPVRRLRRQTHRRAHQTASISTSGIGSEAHRVGLRAGRMARTRWSPSVMQVRRGSCSSRLAA